MKVIYKAAAKINLMLDILTTLDNGYHSLFMLMQSVDLFDTVEVENNNSGKIEIFCSNQDIPCNKSNIAYKAAEAFYKKTGVTCDGLKIDIDKHIPFAAGMAGGSADGAAVIVALDDIYSTSLTWREKVDIGLSVGADVPFCLTGGTCLAQNVGDVLSPLPLIKDCWIVLAKPERGVSTKEAFNAFDKSKHIRHLDTCGMLYAASQGNLNEICRRTKNVFEQIIEVPERVPIKAILNRHGALTACMSGSGPTVFGIFDDESKAISASESLKSVAKSIFITRPIESGVIKEK